MVEVIEPVSRPPTPQYALLGRDVGNAQAELAEWSSMLDIMDQAAKAMARQAPQLNTLEQATTSSKSWSVNADDKQITLSPLMPRYHRKVPDNEMPLVDRKVSGPIRTNVRMFLHEFRTTGMLAYGKTTFASSCYRLLALANMDAKARDALEAAYEKDKDGVWNWDRCEQTFVDSSLTALEKAAEVEEFAKSGRERGESYKEYALRLGRLVHVYRVQELPKHADVLQTLQKTVPSLALTVMNQGMIIKFLLDGLGLQAPNLDTIDLFMKSIPMALGPDDCTEWKTAIEAAKRSRANKEGEEVRVAQQAKDKQQHQQKKATVVQVPMIAMASTGATATPAQTSNAPYTFSRGGYGGRGYYRGRGGRGHPYHRGGFNGNKQPLGGQAA
ncbi:hypothetical protein BC939DRAFT_462564 [Gamsiella multidivaricata]|uniref:uncharacterized protein n=1 Tax=Gamsiella multidivaricata TaxID=101098 RepID=UPI0022205ACF|nr:uncharacterized protein BC939DRAFT_462564 [Gamsiella multidivaricata]KAI7818581.1 hypothetical protein BC939DRAFT_462564 [Gamsiella multidivaricata]